MLTLMTIQLLDDYDLLKRKEKPFVHFFHFFSFGSNSHLSIICRGSTFFFPTPYSHQGLRPLENPARQHRHAARARRPAGAPNTGAGLAVSPWEHQIRQPDALLFCKTAIVRLQWLRVRGLGSALNDSSRL